MNQMNMSWMTEGRPWMRVGVLQAQLLGMYWVPNEIQEHRRAPTFHRQL